jgi:D-Tyr-tRNAtyr deacylase
MLQPSIWFDYPGYLQVDGKIISSIGPGLLCLVGLKEGDTDKDAEYICKARLWLKSMEAAVLLKA